MYSEWGSGYFTPTFLFEFNGRLSAFQYCLSSKIVNCNQPELIRDILSKVIRDLFRGCSKASDLTMLQEILDRNIENLPRLVKGVYENNRAFDYNIIDSVLEFVDLLSKYCKEVRGVNHVLQLTYDKKIKKKKESMCRSNTFDI